MLADIFEAIVAAGGRPLIVGGFVRDMVLDVDSKDVDVEVYGLSVNDFVDVLSRFGQVDLVGQSFGVIKVHGIDADWSLPRRENKSGQGHRGFVVGMDPWMSVEEAASRRDFTFNALSLDPLTGEIVDPFGGVRDLQERTLRHTSEQFGEDPLRVLRGMQFCGRFDLRAAPETLGVCRSLLHELPHLSKERIWEEWHKWASRSVKPSMGLRFLEQCGWWSSFLPDLHVPQERLWHPEGDVFEHTCQCVDAAATIARRDGLSEDDTVVLVFAALCHDLGKISTTQKVRGRITSHGHPEAGAQPTRLFMQSIGAPSWLVEQVVPLVVEHMAFMGEQSERSVRRLSVRLGTASISQLVNLIEVDHAGRHPASAGLPAGAVQMLAIASAEQIARCAPQPILMGRHLIDLGHQPGREMGVLLRLAFEAQLDGQFTDLPGAIDWVGNL